MDILAYVIITVVLMGIAIALYYYVNYYITYNMLQTAEYVESLVYNALVHEFQIAISLASLNYVEGNFTYYIMLPTASLPLEGAALNYVVVLYPINVSGVTILGANVTVYMESSGIRVKVSRGPLEVYSVGQPIDIVAYGCMNSNTPVMLIPAQNGAYCVWSSAGVMMGNVRLLVIKNPS